MSTRKGSPKAQVKNNKKDRLAEKSMSFHGRVAEDMVVKLIRPRTVPDLITGRVSVSTETLPRPKLTKLLLNVTVQRSLGPVHVLISPESTVGDLIAAALRQYTKEGRRPILPSLNPSGFDLHYSQFSLESLAPEETLNELGSRNFFLCPKQPSAVAGSSDGHGEIGVRYDGMTTSTPPPPSSSSCSKEADKVTKGGGAGWLRFMEFML